MIPQRPSNVPDSATLVYPGQTYGPGYGVQQSTLTRISAIINKQNADMMVHYSNGLHDWSENASIYQSLGLSVPPPPQVPHVTVLKVVYADAGGNVVDPPAGADGLHYAWAEEVTA